MLCANCLSCSLIMQDNSLVQFKRLMLCANCLSSSLIMQDNSFVRNNVAILYACYFAYENEVEETEEHKVLI